MVKSYDKCLDLRHLTNNINFSINDLNIINMILFIRRMNKDIFLYI